MYSDDQLNAILDKAAKELEKRGAISQEDAAKKLAQLRAPETFDALKTIVNMLESEESGSV